MLFPASSSRPSSNFRLKLQKDEEKEAGGKKQAVIVRNPRVPDSSASGSIYFTI